MEKLIEIREDVFDVSSRIKSIDENYKIYFNRGTCRYELHDCTKTPTFQAVFPFDCLDVRALDFARKTRVQNIEKILAEIDDHNAKIQATAQDKLIDRILSGLDL